MKHKYLSILLLSSQLCLMGASQTNAADATEIRTGPVMGKAGHDQVSLVEGNLGVINAFREFYRKYSDGSGADVCLAEPHDIFIPYAKHLSDHMRKDVQSEHLRVLIKEVDSHITEKKISPNWLFDMHFRYAVVQGDVSNEERELLDHVPHNTYLQALLAKDLDGKPIVLDLYKWGAHLDKQDVRYYDQGDHVPYIAGTSHELDKRIDQEIAKRLSSVIIYPSLGEATLPIRMLIRNWFMEIYHVAFPSTNTSYHGIKDASRVGFPFHDLFHYTIDQRRTSLHTYIQQTLGQYVEAGKGFAVDILPQVVDLAVQKYILIMDALKKAYMAVEEDSHAVVGLFGMIHELERNFSPAFFNFSNPNMIIEAMLQEGLQHYSSQESWENPDDPLNTTVDGQSQLTDQDIITLALKRLSEEPTLILPYQIYEKRDGENSLVSYASDPEERRQIGLKWLSENTRKTVTRLSQFVDVKVAFADGSEKTVSFPTLKRKLINADASLGLLRFAGLKDLVTPKLSGQNASKDREDALKFIALLKNKLTGTMQDFAQKAQKVFGEGSGSYAEEFERRYKAIEERLNATAKIKPSEKKEEELLSTAK